MPSSSPLPVGTLESLAETLPEWYRKEPTTGYWIVEFKPYLGHHPTEISVDAHRDPYLRALRISWDAPKKRYTISSNTADIDSKTVEPDITTLRNTLKDLAAETIKNTRYTQISSIRGDNGRIPSSTAKALQEKFGSLYHCLNATDQELLNIDSIGLDELTAIKSPSNSQPGNTDWAWYTVCPDCETTFWAVANNYKDDETPPDALRILPKLYCPTCRFDQFTQTYVSDPQPFTNTETDAPGRTTLDSFL